MEKPNRFCEPTEDFLRVLTDDECMDWMLTRDPAIILMAAEMYVLFNADWENTGSLAIVDNARKEVLKCREEK